jgi:hypothetical protein
VDGLWIVGEQAMSEPGAQAFRASRLQNVHTGALDTPRRASARGFREIQGKACGHPQKQRITL